jgi:hypothetical protein
MEFRYQLSIEVKVQDIPATPSPVICTTWIHSKTVHGCLKPYTILNLIYTMCTPIHAYLNSSLIDRLASKRLTTINNKEE